MNTSTLMSLIFSYCRITFLTISLSCTLWLSNQTFAVAVDAYRLNPGDKLEITVWEEDKLKQEVVVLPDGTISFPLVGHVPAAGKTTENLVILLRESLSKFIPDAEINVRLLAADGNKIFTPIYGIIPTKRATACHARKSKGTRLF